MSILTDARNALWDAIDNWPGLESESTTTGRAFQQTFRFNDDSDLGSAIQPALGDLPAVAILPVSSAPEWFTHELQQWPLLFEFRLWTADWSLPEAEALLEATIRAIYQAGEIPGVSYVKATTGYHPRQLGPLTFEFARAGDRGPKVTLARFTLGLRVMMDPFA